MRTPSCVHSMVLNIVHPNPNSAPVPHIITFTAISRFSLTGFLFFDIEVILSDILRTQRQTFARGNLNLDFNFVAGIASIVGLLASGLGLAFIIKAWQKATDAGRAAD